MRIKKKIPFKKKRKFAVVVDGETEFWYLQMLRRNEKSNIVDIKPEIPQKKKLTDQFERVLELAKYYDRVFWIIDLDVILNESAFAKRNQPKPIDILLRYKNKIKKNYKHVSILINQPCLEFWFLLHFENTAQQFVNCGEAEKRLKKHLTDYIKSEKYFTKQDNDIYLKLKAKLPDAISNSMNQDAFDMQNPYKGLTEMHKLFEAIDIA